MINVDNYRLIALTLLLSSTAVLVNIDVVRRQFIADNHTKNRLFILGALLVGTGLLTLHFLDMLAIPPVLNINAGHSIFYLLMSWLIAILIGGLTTYYPSQKTLPMSSLLIGSSLCSLGGYSMYYFSIQGLQIAPDIVFNPKLGVIAFFVGTAFAALYLMVLFWLKNYTHGRTTSTKILFSLLTAFGLTGMHIAYNTTVRVAPNASSLSHTIPETTLLGIAVALACICLFCVAFIITIFYDKFNQTSFSFNRIKIDSNHELSKLAMIDPLTKLPNRRALEHNLEAGARRCLRTSSSMALAFIDLDNFKPINDNYGHQVGDELLINVANRLNSAVRNCDVVTRIGGDEFVALIEDIQSSEDIVPILERIVHSINESFLVKQHQLFISASVGVAVYPKDGNLEQLISCADAAMYRAKSDGKNQFKFFNAEIELASDHMREMQKDLKSALANNEFTLQFQLKIDSTTQAPVGAEALIRWNHPTKGLISPNSFIQEAERSGLIGQINNWVLEETCRTLHRMRLHGIMLGISVNLSSQQFRNLKLAEEIKALLTRFELPTSSIIFEVSEASATKNPELFGTLLASFKAVGLRVAIDNFGANPFNLAYLKNLEITELKLDKLFIADVSSNNETLAIVEAVIKLAHALQLSVTAEGVETEGQRKVLARLGCDQMQGYLFSRPLAEIKLVEMLKQPDSGFVADDGLFVKDYLRTINNSQE